VNVATNRHDEAELNMIFEDFMPKENQESTPKESVEKPKTLNLGIYQEYFDAILSGEKKIEYRQVVPYTYKHYLQLDSMGQPKCNPATTVRW
jgi:hypothetical protein